MDADADLARRGRHAAAQMVREPHGAEMLGESVRADVERRRDDRAEGGERRKKGRQKQNLAHIFLLKELTFLPIIGKI